MKRAAVSFLALSYSLLSSSSAMSLSPPASVPTEGETSAPAVPSSDASTLEGSPDGKSTPISQEFKEFVADGQPLVLEHLGATLVPPSGWQVQLNGNNLSVVMREPEQENLLPNGKKDYSKPKYQRNITMAAIHESSAIDELRAESLKAELQKSFENNNLVADYRVLEHSFFDYRGKKDGLIVYATMTIGEFPMMQMNMLVSGENKQFLMTYTDLADRFRDQPDLMNEAWQAMASISVTGEPEGRYDRLITGGISVGVLAVLILGIGLLRRMRTRKLFAEVEAYDGESDDGDSDWSLGDDEEQDRSAKRSKKGSGIPKPKSRNQYDEDEDFSDLQASVF